MKVELLQLCNDPAGGAFKGGWLGQETLVQNIISWFYIDTHPRNDYAGDTDADSGTL